MFENIKDIKADFRAKHKKLRSDMLPEIRAEKDALICKAVLSTMAYENAGQVLMYAPLPIEVSVRSIFDIALSDGKKVLLPVCGEQGYMKFRYVSDYSALSRGKYGISEPIGDFPEYAPDNADVCIVPALTYDSCGYRMGFGKGYYDRFLSGFTGTKIGVCYYDNIEKALPRGKYDAKVDVLITEKGLFRIKVRP